MKKNYFMLAVAAMMFAACSETDLMSEMGEMEKAQEISFESFANKTTRAEITDTTALQGRKAYGFSRLCKSYGIQHKSNPSSGKHAFPAPVLPRKPRPKILSFLFGGSPAFRYGGYPTGDCTGGIAGAAGPFRGLLSIHQGADSKPQQPQQRGAAPSDLRFRRRNHCR